VKSSASRINTGIPHEDFIRMVSKLTDAIRNAKPHTKKVKISARQRLTLLVTPNVWRYWRLR